MLRHIRVSALIAGALFALPAAAEEKRGLGGLNWSDKPGAYEWPKRTTIEPGLDGKYNVYRDGYRSHTLEPTPRGYELRERGNSFKPTKEFERKYSK